MASNGLLPAPALLLPGGTAESGWIRKEVQTGDGGRGEPLLLGSASHPRSCPGLEKETNPIPGCLWSFPLVKLAGFMEFQGVGLFLQQEKHHLDDLKGLFQPK